MKEIMKALEEIKEHQMQTVQLARSTKVYQLADKALTQALSLYSVSESTYPEEFVHLAKGNYLDKDGSIKKAQTMKDYLGNEYFMVAKDKLYSR